MISQDDLKQILVIAQVSIEGHSKWLREQLGISDAELQRLYDDLTKTLGGE